MGREKTADGVQAERKEDWGGFRQVSTWGWCCVITLRVFVRENLWDLDTHPCRRIRATLLPVPDTT